VLVSALSLTCAVKLVRASSPRSRGLALAGIVALAAVLEWIRRDGAAFGLAGVLARLTIAFFVMRPGFLLAGLIATPILLGAVLSRPDVQLRTYVALQSAARQHWGMVVVSQGHPYKLLDERLYPDVNRISDLQFAETLGFWCEPSWHSSPFRSRGRPRSRAAVAYLPEQIIWYALVALALFGALFAFRYDALVAALLVGHALVVAAAVAFTSGNVGTLVRHRGLALPYIVWLSGVGACELFAASRRSHPLRQSIPTPSLSDMRSA
jgi:hypothetical protein